MNYIGSKKKLLPFIKEAVYDVVGRDLSATIFCDLFAGSGSVSLAFKGEVKSLICNDLEYFSYVLNRHSVGNTKALELQNLFDTLNALKGVEGFIFEHYAKHQTSQREYFSSDNARLIDAMRLAIEKYRQHGTVNEDGYFFLLASLLESADKVANTASVYGAYLKYLKPLAQKKLIIEPIIYDGTQQNNAVHNEDALELIHKIQGDILYLDPPYNVRQYGADYHLLNTIALYDTFTPQGKTGRRDYNRSAFCKKREAASVLKRLIQAARFKYIFMSYSSDGILSEEQIAAIMQPHGEYTCKSVEHKRFGRKRTETKTIEYLHVLVKA